MQDELVFPDNDCVAGVRSTLVPNDIIGTLGEDVDNLTLPLVPPLCTHHNDTPSIGSKHPCGSSKKAQKKPRGSGASSGRSYGTDYAASTA